MRRVSVGSEHRHARSAGLCSDQCGGHCGGLAVADDGLLCCDGVGCEEDGGWEVGSVSLRPRPPRQAGGRRVEGGQRGPPLCGRSR